MRRILLAFVLLGLLLPVPGAAVLKLDNIYFDPAIIAAGDEVDIVVQYHDTFVEDQQDKMDDPDFRFRVWIEPDDTLSTNYVTLHDAAGDDLYGAIYSGGHYNKRFRVKVDADAPAGDYEFRLVGQWYEDGAPVGAEKYVRFRMPVKKEGIVLGVGSLTTTPAEVRPGDDYVHLTTVIENSGEKAAKDVEVTLVPPEGLEASYSGDNRVWIGMLESGGQREASFYLDVSDDVEPGSYDLRFRSEYMDVDHNEYQESFTLPFRLKPRPHLEVVDVRGEGLAGRSGKLYVTLENTGSEDAESVDVRIIKNSVQPFSTDVRSDYLGVLSPGENATALFDLDVRRDAEPKEYGIKLLVRAKGDSDSGDDDIYTFNREAEFDVTGKAPNTLLFFGGGGLALVLLGLLVSRVRRS